MFRSSSTTRIVFIAPRIRAGAGGGASVCKRTVRRGQTGPRGESLVGWDGVDEPVDRREQIGGLLTVDTAFVDDLMGCLLELLGGMPRSSAVAVPARGVAIDGRPWMP